MRNSIRGGWYGSRNDVPEAICYSPRMIAVFNATTQQMCVAVHHWRWAA